MRKPIRIRESYQKFLKLYENNEFVYAMRKFTPTGYIKKQKKNPTRPEFNMLFEREEATFKHNNG